MRASQRGFSVLMSVDAEDAAELVLGFGDGLGHGVFSWGWARGRVVMLVIVMLGQRDSSSWRSRPRPQRWQKPAISTISSSARAAAVFKGSLGFLGDVGCVQFAGGRVGLVREGKGYMDLDAWRIAVRAVHGVSSRLGKIQSLIWPCRKVLSGLRWIRVARSGGSAASWCFSAGWPGTVLVTRKRAGSPRPPGPVVGDRKSVAHVASFSPRVFSIANSGPISSVSVGWSANSSKRSQPQAVMNCSRPVCVQRMLWSQSQPPMRWRCEA